MKTRFKLVNEEGMYLTDPFEYFFPGVYSDGKLWLCETDEWTNEEIQQVAVDLEELARRLQNYLSHGSLAYPSEAQE